MGTLHKYFTKMENVEEAKQQATEAIEKFGQKIKDLIQGLLAKCKGQAPDEADLYNIGYLAGLQAKYEEAIKAMDEAIHGSDSADGFWDMVKEKLEGVVNTGTVPLPEALER